MQKPPPLERFFLLLRVRKIVIYLHHFLWNVRDCTQNRTLAFQEKKGKQMRMSSLWLSKPRENWRQYCASLVFLLSSSHVECVISKMNVVVSKRMHAVFPTYQKSLQMKKGSIWFISLYHIFVSFCDYWLASILKIVGNPECMWKHAEVTASALDNVVLESESEGRCCLQDSISWVG